MYPGVFLMYPGVFLRILYFGRILDVFFVSYLYPHPALRIQHDIVYSSVFFLYSHEYIYDTARYKRASVFTRIRAKYNKIHTIGMCSSSASRIRQDTSKCIKIQHQAPYPCVLNALLPALLPKGKELCLLIITGVWCSHRSTRQGWGRLHNLSRLHGRLLRCRRLQLLHLVSYVVLSRDVVDGQNMRADAIVLEALAGNAVVLG